MQSYISKLDSLLFRDLYFFLFKLNKQFSVDLFLSYCKKYDSNRGDELTQIVLSFEKE